jgi:hypothetical protein
VGAFGRRSQIDGNSGEDEIMTSESSCNILAEEAGVAILDLSSRENAEKNEMRPARPNRAQRILGDVRFVTKWRIVVSSFEASNDCSRPGGS